MTERKKLAIAISCYPTYGGSGVIATEVGMEMARRGHRVHFISYEVPKRLTNFFENIFFHEVDVSNYPLFAYPPYDLSLASKMVEVTEAEQIDIIHVHYAIPHAVSAFLAKSILKERSPKIITTLHGTDITLVGNDRSFLPITKLSILESDGVTAVSQYLKMATYNRLNIPTRFDIEVIYNFVDLNDFRTAPEMTRKIRNHLCKTTALDGVRVITHVSNFRPVKRIEDVVETFYLVQQQVDSRLVLIGDGPERSKAEMLCKERGISSKVCFLGKQDSFHDVLASSDLFLLPSQSESFGLAALEAMACGVPVIATRTGGVPELIQHGVTGFLSDVGDVREMADNAIKLLTDSKLRAEFGAAARNIAETKFELTKIADSYEDYYYKILGI